MEAYLQMGLTLTVILISISAMSTITEGLGLDTSKIDTQMPTTAEMQTTASSVTLDLNQSKVTIGTIGSILGGVQSVWNGISSFINIIFRMGFGWTNVFSKLFGIWNLAFIGNALIGIFLFIQIATILALLVKVIGSMRGAG